tara:strand:+ start:3614 stop:3955 length:342 start_codon:yes stop_codon:yes gene_type:complete
LEGDEKLKADEAIEIIKEKQKEMMREAQRMSERADKLQAIAECQDLQGGGYQWQVSEIVFTDCLMKVKHLRMFCVKTGVSFELKPNHSDNKYGLLMLDNENMSLEEFIGGEEE